MKLKILLTASLSLALANCYADNQYTIVKCPDHIICDSTSPDRCHLVGGTQQYFSPIRSNIQYAATYDLMGASSQQFYANSWTGFCTYAHVGNEGVGNIMIQTAHQWYVRPGSGKWTRQMDGSHACSSKISDQCLMNLEYFFPLHTPAK